jgi:hypothetical protein
VNASRVPSRCQGVNHHEGAFAVKKIEETLTAFDDVAFDRSTTPFARL